MVASTFRRTRSQAAPGVSTAARRRSESGCGAGRGGAKGEQERERDHACTHHRKLNTRRQADARAGACAYAHDTVDCYHDR
eukprot:40950-Pleurochrysis_carterae.AAC.2